MTQTPVSDGYRGKSIALSGIALMIPGLVFSPLVLSLGTIITGISIFFAAAPKRWISNLYRGGGVSLWPIAVFVLAFFSFFQTDDISLWLDYIRLKLPFLVLPLAVAAHSGFKENEYRWILRIVYVVFSLTALLSLGNYLLHYDEINALILHSKPVPVIGGQSHIYFSVMLAFAFFAALPDIFTTRLPKWGRGIAVFSALVALLALHVLSVRTGLLAFYFAAFFTALVFLIRKKAWKIFPVLLLLLFLIPVIAVYTIPSLRNRFQNTIEDVQNAKAGGNANYRSLGTRFEAWQVSWLLFKQHPVTGIGMPEIKQKMIDTYKNSGSVLLIEHMITPHNQYLECLAGNGIIGGILLLGMLFSPFFFLKRLQVSTSETHLLLLVAFICIMVAAFFVESLLERQAGIAFFIVTREVLLHSGTGKE